MFKGWKQHAGPRRWQEAGGPEVAARLLLGLWLRGLDITGPRAPGFLLSMTCWWGTLVLEDHPLVLFDVRGPLTQGNPFLGCAPDFSLSPSSLC